MALEMVNITILNSIKARPSKELIFYGLIYIPRYINFQIDTKVALAQGMTTFQLLVLNLRYKKVSNRVGRTEEACRLKVYKMYMTGYIYYMLLYSLDLVGEYSL